MLTAETITTLAIAFILMVILIALCVRETLINYYNPLPKFENGDKRISEIDVVKSRSIR